MELPPPSPLLELVLMKRFYARRQFGVSYGLAILWAGSTVGCNGDRGAIRTLREAVRSVSSTTDERDQSLDSSTAKMDRDDVQNFTPLYPERTDAFAYPGSATESQGGPVAMTSVAEIQVLGFANLGTPQVFLRQNRRPGPCRRAKTSRV